MDLQIAALESECSIANLKKEDLTTRKVLAEELIRLPKDAFAKLRFLVPQSGCFNRCAFCSQSASTSVWQFNESGLRNLFAAIKTALQIAYPNRIKLTEEGVFTKDFTMPNNGLVGFRRDIRPGVICSYYDNDVGSYRYLDKYLKFSKEDLGTKTRISSVGYSRHNDDLQKMHSLICNKQLEHIFNIRFSITPYTYGLTMQGEHAGTSSKKEFLLDLANMFETYKTAMNRFGSGKYSFCSELRFKPLVVTEHEVNEEVIKGHHVIHCGPYLVVNKSQSNNMQLASISDVGNSSRSPLLNAKSQYCWLIISDKFNTDNFWKDNAEELISSGKLASHKSGSYVLRDVKCYKFNHSEGPYYAIEPQFNSDGVYAKEIYPRTPKRETCGYIDSERYFLNTIINYKKSVGLKAKEPFSQATWHDVDTALSTLHTHARFFDDINKEAAQHIKNDIISIVEMYTSALRIADVHPKYFFDPKFTIDTGDICNMGRAIIEFKGLTKLIDTPITPQQERSFGNISYLAEEKEVWLAAPLVYKNRIEESRLAFSSYLLIEKHNLPYFAGRKKEYIPYRKLIPIGIDQIENLSISDSKYEYLFPGQKNMLDKVNEVFLNDNRVGR